MTRGGGKTWHGGMDIVGVDSDIILMPYYEMPDGTQKLTVSSLLRVAAK